MVTYVLKYQIEIAAYDKGCNKKGKKYMKNIHQIIHNDLVDQQSKRDREHRQKVKRTNRHDENTKTPARRLYDCKPQRTDTQV